jgi:putative Ca2+/H+ antiporter (TMEM165/GDT1 family)
MHASMLVAMIANPAMSGDPGDRVTRHVTENNALDHVTAFIAMAVLAFFLAERRDKSQIATVMLAAAIRPASGWCWGELAILCAVFLICADLNQIAGAGTSEFRSSAKDGTRHQSR